MPHVPAILPAMAQETAPGPSSLRHDALRCLVALSLHQTRPMDRQRRILAALRLAGLRGRVVRHRGWPALEAPGDDVPVMGLMRDGRWVIIVKATAWGPSPVVHILDPADQRRGVLALPRDAFLLGWGGTLVVVGPRGRRPWVAAVAASALAASVTLFAVAPLGPAAPRTQHVAVAEVVPPVPAAPTHRQTWLRAQQARLEAELDDAAFDPPSDGPAWTLQQTLHRQRQAQRGARLQTFVDRMNGNQTEIALAMQGRALLAQQLDLAREMEGMRSALFKVQSGSRLSLMEAQAARLHAERELQSADMQLHAMRHAALSIQAERQAYLDTWRQDLLEALIQTRADAAAVPPDAAPIAAPPIAGLVSQLLDPASRGTARGARGTQNPAPPGHGGPPA